LIQMYKFITITADNASNNRMMMASLATRLHCTDPVGDYDSDHSTICCLAHVIHLLVMDLLVNIKAVAKWEASNSPIDVAINTDEQAAEDLGVNDPNGISDKSDRDVWVELECHTEGVDNDETGLVDMKKVIWKVRFHVSFQQSIVN